MRKIILDELRKIEAQENVFIFLACESGSRAWGFPSADSDYDVRFLYVRPKNWYLSINLEQKRDVIERPLSDNLDISGWDISKALTLFRKSNPPLLEWLGSPMIYLEKSKIASKLRELVPRYYSPKSCFYHYLSMTRNNYKRNVKGDQIRHKAYFYVLRPLLACKWIAADMGVAPMEFERLFNRLIDEPELKEAVEDLIERKRNGSEMDWGPAIPVVSSYMERELEKLEAVAGEMQTSESEIELLNNLFREAIEEAEYSRGI